MSQSQIQWFPGHMTKALRMMQENISLVDLVVEILDARCPISTRNPEIQKLAQNKSRLVLLNKADLADINKNEEWESVFKAEGATCAVMSAKNPSCKKEILALIQEACKEKIERDKRKGIKNRPIRVMVTGIPNVGKSTVINLLAGRASAKTGNKPGVTKGKQWIKLSQNIELLDTPGVLWPRFDDALIGEHLALIGSVNDTLLNMDELAISFLKQMDSDYPGVVESRYGFTEEDLRSDVGMQEILCIEENKRYVAILRQIAFKRNALVKAGEPDVSKAAKLIIDDFRAARLGKISLESANKQ
ncbi:MAG: ribosome biogenesis GTPase YlqF [Lachnospiraceae bacterium]|nr:ribosome biogenesis GTPase YlqF [Lachnospiraceae bacterium]